VRLGDAGTDVRNFNAFIDLKSLELEVPTVCLVKGCVSGHRTDVSRKVYFERLL
jgi:hypothetical protein